MNADRPRVPIGDSKTVDTTREVIALLDKYIPPKQKTLLLSVVIADFAAALDRNPSYIIKQFYDRLYGKETMHFLSVNENLLRNCMAVLMIYISPTLSFIYHY